MRLRFICLTLLILLTGIYPGFAQAADEAPLAVELNTEPRGTLIALIEHSGDILLHLDDLKALGILVPADSGEPSEQNYRSLSDIDGLEFNLNMETLTLELMADSSILTASDFNLDVVAGENILRPEPNSAFLNYSLNVGGGNGTTDTNLLFTNELGIRKNRYLFLTNSQLVNDSFQSNFIRLDTSLIYEDPVNFNRSVFGDVFSTSGFEASGLQLGGVQFSRNFRMDPYYRTYPGLALTGTVDVPTEIEVFLDGHSVLKEWLPPGPYNLNNIRRYRGAGVIEIVMRDTYGREERIVQPFYLSDDLLKHKLHAFSYSAGARREQFGAESFNYGDFIFQGFHDYGWLEELTIGTSAEGSSDVSNLIPRIVWQPGNWGSLRSTLGASTSTDGFGYESSIGYQYFGRAFGLQCDFKYASEAFATVAILDSTERPEFEFIANVSYHAHQLGSLTLDTRIKTDHFTDGQNRIGATYSRRLTRNLSLVASIHTTTGLTEEDRAFISLNYLFNPEVTISAIGEVTATGNQFDLQVEKLRPVGEGYSYKALLRQSNDDVTGATTMFNPLFEYRGKNGIYLGEAWAETGGINGLSYRLQASGAIIALGGKFGLTRPVSDSFALVKVSDIEGIPVSMNNQVIGRTDEEGKLFIAEINSYFNNQISIDDRQIPINRALKSRQHLVAPPLRSGFCLYFDAPEIQPIIGHLYARSSDGLIPLEFTEFKLTTADGAVLAIPTGHGGEFYYDPSEKQLHSISRAQVTDCNRIAESEQTTTSTVALSGSIVYNGQTQNFSIEVPDSDEFFVDAGQVIVNPDRTDRTTKPTGED